MERQEHSAELRSLCERLVDPTVGDLAFLNVPEEDARE